MTQPTISDNQINGGARITGVMWCETCHAMVTPPHSCAKSATDDLQRELLTALKVALPWVAIAIFGDAAFGIENPKRVSNHAEDLALIQAAIAKAEGR